LRYFATCEVAAALEVASAGLTPAASGPFRWVAPDRLALLDLGRLGLQGEG